RQSFQSTPSIQRETKSGSRRRSGRLDFNPLPPYRGRLPCKPTLANGGHFNPLPPYRGRPFTTRLLRQREIQFQSTPSIQRETATSCCEVMSKHKMLIDTRLQLKNLCISYCIIPLILHK